MNNKLTVSYEDATDKEHPHHGVHLSFLYDLLKERLTSVNVNISHAAMPTYEKHIDFVEKNSGYKLHFVIVNADVPTQCIGTLYATTRNEIGLFIIKRHQEHGYGKEAIRTLLREYPDQYYANVHPENYRSRAMFTALGFKALQYTYAIDTTPETDQDQASSLIDRLDV